MKKRLSLVLLLMLPGTVSAAVNLFWSNGLNTKLMDVNSMLLPTGSPTVNSDGTLVQLGYYSSSTSIAPFTGLWVQLGELTMGDVALRMPGFGTSYYEEVDAGLFRFDDNGNEQVIANGAMLAVRFFDSGSAGASTYFNAATSPDWQWSSDRDKLSVNLSAASILEWQDGPSSAFRATIAIPEPSAILLLGGAAAGWCMRRRKQGVGTFLS